jgi:diketogulonate reductase-like aldo/keto reductase
MLTQQKFGLEYVDLWLMHWPVAGNDGYKVDPPLKDTWQRMEKQFDAGKAKVCLCDEAALGVDFSASMWCN